MKILQINKFHYRRAGAEVVFLDEIEALREAGHEVSIFSMKHEKNLPTPYEKYFIENIEFGAGSKKTLKKAEHFVYSKEAARNLARLLEDEKPDVAHLHNISHHLTPAILDVLRWKKIPVVQTLHDYQLICPNYKLYTQGSPCEKCNAHKYWNTIRYKCVQGSRAASALAAFEMGFHNILRGSYKKGVKKFIAPSHFMQNKIQEWGWSPDQITYLPNFVERTPDNSIATVKNQVAYIGRLTTEKGVHVLLEAAKQLPDVQFHIAGSGEEERAMKQTIAQKQLNNVTMLGFLNKEEVDALIQESAAVIVPSLWWENAPLSILEPLALGTPVIGSNSGGIPELLQDGTNGYTFEPGNAKELAASIEKLLNGSPLQIPANQYTKASHIQRLQEIYENVIGS